MASSKRKPLSDITNTYNLIPTSALQKLVAAASTSDSFLKPPISISKSNSSSTKQKVLSDSSRSITSIGSSNVRAKLNSKKTVQFRSPPPAASSITSPGGFESKDAVYNRRKTIEKSKKEREMDVIMSCTPVEMRKDKGKAIYEPFSPLTCLKMKNYHNDTVNPSTPFVRQNRRGANLSLSDNSVEMVKISEKGILNSSSHSFEKADKGKVISNSSRALGKERKLGKGTIGNSSCSLEKTNDGKEGVLKHLRSSTVDFNERGQESLNPCDFFVDKTRQKRKSLNTFNSLNEKTSEKEKAMLQLSDTNEIIESLMDKGKPTSTFNSSDEKRKEGKAILQHTDIVEVAEDKGSSDAVAVKSRPPRRQSMRSKFDAVASSCPPVMRSKSIKNGLDEAGFAKSSKSWTHPHSKRRKKTCSRIENTCELPQSYIEEQKAYFKEVDDFELLEEEATPNELD